MLAPETETELRLTDQDGAVLGVMPRAHVPDELYLGVAPSTAVLTTGVYLTRDMALQLVDHLAGWLYATAMPADPDACTDMCDHGCGETPDAVQDGYGWPDVTGTQPASVALEAHAAVYGDREDDYGHPREDFTRTAVIWTGLLQHKLADGAYIDPEDIARCQIGVKLARDVHSPKRDNRVDMAGYAITLDRLETGR